MRCGWWVTVDECDEKQNKKTVLSTRYKASHVTKHCSSHFV